jgi:hypothetical protein
VTYPAYVLKRFWVKTETDPELEYNGTPCRIWTGAMVDRHRTVLYGRFCSIDTDGSRRWWVAHQFAYTAYVGPIPPGLEIDHLCRRSRCVEPSHLEPVTGCENRRRAERHRLYSLTCPQGHLWTRENRRPNKNAQGVSWMCAQCNRERVAAFYASGVPIRKRTLADLSPECKNKHPRTKLNTRFNKHGIAICRDCQRKASARWKSRQKIIKGTVGWGDLLDL